LSHKNFFNRDFLLKRYSPKNLALYQALYLALYQALYLALYQALYFTQHLPANGKSLLIADVGMYTI
jgi:hypothetical protein